MQAWVRLIDAHYALGEYRQAADMMAEATARCAGFKQAPEYKVGRLAAWLAGVLAGVLAGRRLPLLGASRLWLTAWCCIVC